MTKYERDRVEEIGNHPFGHISITDGAFLLSLIRRLDGDLKIANQVILLEESKREALRGQLNEITKIATRGF